MKVDTCQGLFKTCFGPSGEKDKMGTFPVLVYTIIYQTESHSGTGASSVSSSVETGGAILSF